MKKTLLLGFAGLLCLPVVAAELTLVSTQSADSLAFHPIKSAPAKVITLNHAKIPARVSGIIERFHFRVGDTIRQGEAIARIDCQDFELALSQTQADKKRSEVTLAFNQRESARAQKLLKNNAVSEAELDRKKTDVSISKSQLASLKINLKQQQLNVERCDIKAPFDGILTARLADVGEQIDRERPAVAELLQSNHQLISAQIALSDQQTFEQAGKYWFEVNQQKWPVKLRHLIPWVKDDSRSLESRLEFIDKTAYSGTTGRIKWSSQVRHLPAYLLQKRQNSFGFFILEGQQARFIPVPDALEGRPIPLPSGLSGSSLDYQLIIDGRFGLSDKQTVKISKKD